MFRPKRMIPKLAVATLALTGSIVAMAGAVITQEWMALAWLATGLGAYYLGMLSLLVIMERSVRRIIAKRNQTTSWLSPHAAIKGLVAVPLTQFVYAASLFAATFSHKVQWRGMSYRVDGPWKIQMLDYRPFRKDEHTNKTAASL